MLNERLVSELIRQRMGWKDDSQYARVVNLVPQALKAFARKYAADPFTRQLTTSDVATAVIPITNGQVDLSVGYDNFQFLMEYFDLGQCYFYPGIILSTGTIPSQPIWNCTDAGALAILGGFGFIGNRNGRASFANDVYVMRWEGDGWYIRSLDDDFAILYRSAKDTSLPPMDAASWTVGEIGVAPGPTFSYVGGSFTMTAAAMTGVDPGPPYTFEDYDQIQFSSTNTYPTGISPDTNYYVSMVQYPSTSADPAIANFQVCSNPALQTSVNVTSIWTGTLTATKMGGNGLQMQQIAPMQMALPQYLSNVFIYYSIQGNVMNLQKVNGVIPSGSVAFSVPVYATNLAGLPESAEAEELFLQTLFEMVASPKDGRNG